tara:strand:+ start:1834 stop:2514 length:681 start_codon:yes stop_codon:yes gene_type:complete
MSKLISATDVSKGYNVGPHKVGVLNGVNLNIYPSQHVAIMGVSGSGKSTLLHCLGGLESPDEGVINLFGRSFSLLSPLQRGQLRNRHIGFIYQFHHLLHEFTVRENVAMPLLIRGDNVASAGAQSLAILERVGLGHRTNHKPSELSGGERQRCAIARALVTNPSCIFADEPTGNLDSKSAENIYELMLEMTKEQGTSLIIVTHDHELAKRMDTVMELKNGTLKEIT